MAIVKNVQDARVYIIERNTFTVAGDGRNIEITMLDTCTYDSIFQLRWDVLFNKESGYILSLRCWYGTTNINIDTESYTNLANQALLNFLITRYVTTHEHGHIGSLTGRLGSAKRLMG